MDRIAQLLWDPTLCVVYLVLGAYVTASTGGVALRRGLQVIRSAWRAPSVRARDVQHRDAFWAALAASVGVGNVAGVATALHLGGPGALFWMWVSALVGMHLRLVSTHLATKYADDRSFATPMAYLGRLLPVGRQVLPRVVAGLLLVVGMVNANLIQSNSVAHTMTRDFGIPPLVAAATLAAGVGIVILGGLRSIVTVSVRLAPWMLGIYVTAGVLVLGSDPGTTVRSITLVLREAIAPGPAAAGAAGYGVFRALQFGVARGIFSHGSGLGLAPFFHSANGDHPARGAFMAAAIPVVDTLVVCSITGLVILSQGLWPWWTSAHLTVSSFELALGPAGKLAVFACLVVFAFTTVNSWAHFAERCFGYLGGRNVVAFRLLVCAVAFAGPFISVRAVWSTADVLMGALLVAHLLPLTWIVGSRLPELWRDLERPVR